MSYLCQAGWTAVTEPVPVPERSSGSTVLVVHTLRDEEDLVSIQTLATAGHRVVALVTDAEVRGHAAALLAGATGTIPWDAEPAQLVASLHAVLHGQATLPPGVAAALAQRVPQGFPDSWLSTQDVQLLQAIRDGLTVTAIADSLGLGQRSAHRLLADLYTKLGATGRIDAILTALRRGVID